MFFWAKNPSLTYSLDKEPNLYFLLVKKQTPSFVPTKEGKSSPGATQTVGKSLKAIWIIYLWRYGWFWGDFAYLLVVDNLDTCFLGKEPNLYMFLWPRTNPILFLVKKYAKNTGPNISLTQFGDKKYNAKHNLVLSFYFYKQIRPSNKCLGNNCIFVHHLNQGYV